MKKRLLIVALLTGLLGWPGHAATVYLKDGSQISGTVVSATAREIQLSTPDGLLKIDTDRINRIDYSATPPTPAPPSPEEVRPAKRAERVDRINPEQTNQQFSINLGLAAPLSRVNLSGAGGGSTDNGDPGFLLGAQYLYEVTPRWASGFNVEYFNRSQSDSLGLLPFADASVSGNTLALMAVAKYSLVKKGAARPYILAGIGANRTTQVIDAQPQFGFAWSDTNSDETRRLVDDSNWGLASTARLGIDFFPNRPTFFSFELGWINLDNKSYDTTQAARDLGQNSVTGHLSAFTVAGRWGWRY